jgi:hypothetical protein
MTPTPDDPPDETPAASGAWGRFRSLHPWSQVAAFVLVGMTAIGVLSSLGGDSATPSRSRPSDRTTTTATNAIGIYEAVARSTCEDAFANPSVRRVIVTTGEPGLKLAVDNFMVGFQQSGDGPTDPLSLAKIRAACERGLREAAGL